MDPYFYIFLISSRQFYLLSNDVTLLVERHRCMVAQKTQPDSQKKTSQNFESVVFVAFDSLASGFYELGSDQIVVAVMHGSSLCSPARTKRVDFIQHKITVFHIRISENKEFVHTVSSQSCSSWLWFHYEQRF